MSLRAKFNCVQVSDVGKVREHNEDAVGVNADAALLVLADGMGGYNAGEVASGITVRTVLELVGEACARENRGALDPATGLMRQTVILRDAIARANRVINQTAETQPQCAGMGTTVVACLFYDNKISIAHVGDSRLYRYRRNRFEQLTMDHSLLQELVDRGFYSQEEAAKSANKNYVTRALGVEPTVQVELQELPAEPGDIYLLCSDGLPDMVEDEDIHLTISTFSANLQMAGQQLIQLSNDHGGKDNISVILAQVVESFPAPAGVFRKLRKIFN
jgi:protein phosphatase